MKLYLKFISISFLFLLIPSILFAQAKPKRDITKDQSAMVTKRATSKKNIVQKKKIARRTKHTVTRKRSYNQWQDSEYVDSLSSYGQWSDLEHVDALFHATASINSANLRHNIWVGEGHYSEKCLQIDVNVSIEGGAGKQFLVVASIMDMYEHPIKASREYSVYGLPQSNDVYVAEQIIPATDYKQTFNVRLNLPNYAMDLSDIENHLCCHLFIYNTSKEEFMPCTYRLNFVAKKYSWYIVTSPN